MYKSLWVLPKEDSITSMPLLKEWLLSHLLPRSAILAWLDHEYPERQRWTINMPRLQAGTVLILETEQPVDFGMSWPSYTSPYFGYQIEQTVVMPYPDIDEFACYPFSLQLCAFQFASTINRRTAIEYWRNKHAQIACDNQSTVTYVQNVVTGQSHDAPDFDGWVEEGFPNENVVDTRRFFGGATLAETRDRLANISQSSSKFIDMESIFVQHYSAIRII